MLVLFYLLLQKFSSIYPQLSNFGSEIELNDVKETIQQLLRWGWKYNKNLEEQAAQLHMLTGWSQIVEVHCCLAVIIVYISAKLSNRILPATLLHMLYCHYTI